MTNKHRKVIEPHWQLGKFTLKFSNRQYFTSTAWIKFKLIMPSSQQYVLRKFI